jgi:hypothetical protein
VALREVMYRGVCSGERRVRVAVLVRRWKVASVMKCGGSSGLDGSEGSEGSDGGWLGLGGGRSCGVWIVRVRGERACPSGGLEGRVPLWVRRVRVVL